MSTRVVSWSERLELTVETAGGETVTLDVPSLLHDAGLLSKITRVDGSVTVRVCTRTGKYIGVHSNLDGNYSALSGYFTTASGSAREVAYKRAIHLATKRKRRDVERPPTRPWQPPPPSHEPTPPQGDEDDDACEFVKERTREERDEEGRANAVVLEED
tara:strand:+ start:2097 stop:2573 length:477 start_codon:yes stop_codon:yes gene_type:complete